MLTLFTAAPFIIINAISGFQRNHSTLSQRVWMMLWIVYPGSIAVMVTNVRTHSFNSTSRCRTQRRWRVVEFLLLLTSGGVVIGGLVTLSKMILENGMCERY